MTQRPTARIAFAIPYYSGLHYLAATLASVRSQTIDDWEAVVVDDAGPEPAADLVASLNDPRIRYVRNESNLGLAGNWNAAVSASTAPYVTILHADDELLPDYAATMVDLLDRHPGALAGHCRVELIDEAGRPTRTLADSVKKVIRPRVSKEMITNGDDGLASLLRGFWIFCPTLCFRRRLFQEARPFESRWRFVVDFSFLANCLFDGHHLVGTPVVGYRYRRYSANQTAILTSELTRFEEELRLYGEIGRRASDAGWGRSRRTAGRALIVRAHLVVAAIKSLVRGQLLRTKKTLGLAVRSVVSNG